MDENMGPANELALHESRLAELDRERALLLGKIKSLKDGAREKQAPSQPSIPKTTAAAPSSFTSSEKVVLFRSLFRGRTDVFPQTLDKSKQGD